tara:strand:- start:655 stop:1752 length:1098 start_codon:yes stop_codon:yes gene_type:complete
MKVCLVGNNLTSLILANILSDKNIYTEITSINNPKSNFKTRTLGIANSNLLYLKKYFKNIEKNTNPINQIQVLIQNIKNNKKIKFDQNSKILFNMIKYDKLISLVRAKCIKNKFITFKYLKKNEKFESSKYKKNFKLIINCEGSNFITKKFLKRTISKNYHNKAFTTLINHSSVDNNKAYQVFTDFGPIAFLPLSKKLTSIVFSFDLKKNKKITETQIIKLINQYNPLYKINSFEKFQSFNLKLNLAKRYYHKNILFFGDSIHTIHPLAGQGFNMTIRDMIKFDEILNQKINLGLTIDESIYKEFEKITKSNNSVFSLGVDLVHEFFKFNKDFIPKKLSDKILDHISDNQKLKNLGINLANFASP